MKTDLEIIEWFQNNKPEQYKLYYNLRYSGIVQTEINGFLRTAYNNYMKAQNEG